MSKDFSNALSNISCLDLLNASWEDINDYCLISNVSNGLKKYLKHLYFSLHNDLFHPNNPHLVFFDDDYIIGSIRNDQSIEQFSLGGPEILPDINSIKLDISLFRDIENKIYKSKELDLNNEQGGSLFQNMLPIILKNYNKDFVQMDIEVIHELVISFPEFCKQYNQNIVFLNCDNQPNLDSLLLHRIFYRNKQAIIFIFKNDIGLEYMGWNKDFILQIRNIKPIKFQTVDNITKLNAVLDKINEMGITRLDADELAYLNSFTNNKV